FDLGFPEYSTFAPEDTFAVSSLDTLIFNPAPELPLTVKLEVLKLCKKALPLEDIFTVVCFAIPDSVNSPELEALIANFSVFNSPDILPAELRFISEDVASTFPVFSFPAEDMSALKLLTLIGSNISNVPAELTAIDSIEELL